MKAIRFLLASLIVFLGIGIFLQPQLSSLAAPPQNDDFDFATLIDSLPYFDSIDTTDATLAIDDPSSNCAWSAIGATVWYSYTASEPLALAINTSGSSYQTLIAVYTGVRGALNAQNCTNGTYLQQEVTAGETYYIMIAAAPTYPYPNPGDPILGGYLNFSVEVIPPPGNDNFADAYSISPYYYDSGDNTSATFEAEETLPYCANPSATKTVWYSFTPAQTDNFPVNFWSNYDAFLGVYTGSELGNLSLVDCYYYNTTLVLQGGTTYYFQLGDQNLGGYYFFELLNPPQLEAWFDYYPYQPSTYDSVYFYDYSYDPAYIGIVSWQWDFGDGTGAEGPYVNHRYTADGSYDVTLTVQTYDGRIDDMTRTILVSTHDIAITRFKVPNSVVSGQTKTITIDLRNYFQPETAWVILYKSTLDGYAWVANQQVYVPVKNGNQVTSLTFRYTFTPEDAQLGKTTFKATAYPAYPEPAYPAPIRDAFPADNEAISPIVTIKR
ncbi:MAG: PKD domain-containing protein [Anaerolineales bacterium]